MTITCSVDARWVEATTYCDYTGNQSLSGMPTTYARLKDTVLDAAGRPSNQGISLPVDLDVSWLNMLIPAFSKAPYGSDTWQSLAGVNSLSKKLNAQVEAIPVASRGSNISIFVPEILE